MKSMKGITATRMFDSLRRKRRQPPAKRQLISLMLTFLLATAEGTEASKPERPEVVAAQAVVRDR
jgi:hypothetical protein